MGYGNSGTGQVLGSASTPVRQSAIAEQMVGLEHRTEHLGQLVAELEARIGAVLAPEPPAAQEKVPPMAHGVVPLGQSLGQIGERLMLIAGRLRTIIDRVEL